MQVKSFLMMLFVFFVLPLFYIFTNHLAFFIIMAIVLFITSLRQVYVALCVNKKVSSGFEQEDLDFIESVESSSGFDLKLLDTGTRVVRYLAAILFYIYCALQSMHISLIVIISALIIYWVYRIKSAINENNNIFADIPFIIERVINFTAGSFSLFVITFITYFRIA